MWHFDLISLLENRSFNYQIDMPSGTYTKRGLITSKHDYHKIANKNKGYSDFYTKTLNKLSIRFISEIIRVPKYSWLQFCLINNDAYGSTLASSHYN